MNNLIPPVGRAGCVNRSASTVNRSGATMVHKTLALIEQVGALVKEHKDFFDAVREWYKDVRLSRKLVRLFLGREEAGAWVSLTVNDHTRAGEPAAVPTHVPTMSWSLPAGALVAGQNEITLLLESTPGASLHARSVAVSQEPDLPRQFLDLSVAETAATEHLEMVLAVDAAHARTCWAVKEGGRLVFRLWLDRPDPVLFVLTLPAEDTDWAGALKELLKRVQEKVKHRRQQLEEEARQARTSDRARVRELDDAIEALNTYLYLHRVQVAPAFESGDAGTMSEVITATGFPDQLIVDFQARAAVPLPVEQPVQAPYAAPPQAPYVAPPRPTMAPPPPPLAALPPRPARRPPRPRGRSCASTCLTILVLGALVVAGSLYAGYKFLIPKPTLQFDSLVENETVPAGMPLQVWVSGNDLLGVESLSLSVDAAPGLVEGRSTFEPLRFQEYTPETGTKVFTLNLGPEPTGEARTITLTATLVTRRGESITTRRAIKIGGREQGLSFAINPPDPKPMQKVDVTVRGVHAPSGAKVTYSLEGTDGWKQGTTLTLGPDGTAHFEVPGSLGGVEDKIEAKIDGTSVSRRVSYHFAQ